jgi:hypothetical protein
VLDEDQGGWGKPGAGIDDFAKQTWGAGLTRVSRPLRVESSGRTSRDQVYGLGTVDATRASFGFVDGVLGR